VQLEIIFVDMNGVGHVSPAPKRLKIQNPGQVSQGAMVCERSDKLAQATAAPEQQSAGRLVEILILGARQLK